MYGLTLVARLQRNAFLNRLGELSQLDPAVRLNAAVVGQQLGFPLERTLDLVDELQEQGLIHQCGRRLDGPPVHLTPRAIRIGQRSAA